MDTSAKAWKPPRRRLLFLLFLFVLSASFFDATSTLALNATGSYYEVNPFVGLTMEVGIGYFLFWKVVSMGLMVGLVAYLARKYRVFWWCMVVSSVLYAGVVLYYLYHIFVFSPS